MLFAMNTLLWYFQLLKSLVLHPNETYSIIQNIKFDNGKISASYKNRYVENKAAGNNKASTIIFS